MRFTLECGESRVNRARCTMTSRHSSWLEDIDERSFWAWHAQARADVARLVRALGSGTFEVEVKRVFRVEMTEAESRATGRLVPGVRAAPAPAIHIASARGRGGMPSETWFQRLRRWGVETS